MSYKMTHEIQYVVGKSYYIDERQNNKEAIVTLLGYGPSQIFCKVKNEDSKYTWDTMLNRLTEIPDVDYSH